MKTWIIILFVVTQLAFLILVALAIITSLKRRKALDTRVRQGMLSMDNAVELFKRAFDGKLTLEQAADVRAELLIEQARLGQQ